MSTSIFVTGGLGFIGSNFVIHALNHHSMIYVLDNESYAANRGNLPDNDKIHTIKVDITDLSSLDQLYDQYNPIITFHFAAQTHVDNSISDDSPFITTNIVGTHNILKCVKKCGSKLIHISTDEVFGSLTAKQEPFTEESPYNPNNPYSATKASADHLVRSYVNTYGVMAVVTNCSNNYGPRQHTEKLIPTIISRAKRNEYIPIYGNGLNIRDWLYVEDHCNALNAIATNFIPGERYNIGGGFEVSNIELAEKILDIMGKPRSLIQFVPDRLGHDFRYAINSSKIRSQLQWHPMTDIDDGLVKTLEWYK